MCFLNVGSLALSGQPLDAYERLRAGEKLVAGSKPSTAPTSTTPSTLTSPSRSVDALTSSSTAGVARAVPSTSAAAAAAAPSAGAPQLDAGADDGAAPTKKPRTKKLGAAQAASDAVRARPPAHPPFCFSHFLCKSATNQLRIIIVAISYTYGYHMC